MHMDSVDVCKVILIVSLIIFIVSFVISSAIAFYVDSKRAASKEVQTAYEEFADGDDGNYTTAILYYIKGRNEYEL